MKKNTTMKYIEAEKIKAEIDKIIDALKISCNPNPLGKTYECMVAAELEALGLVKSVIDQMQQEEPLPPGIENESQKKGWLDYGLTMGEIGLHRYNAIHRIKEHKEQFDTLTIPGLYHVAEYSSLLVRRKPAAACSDTAWTSDLTRKM